MKVIMVMFDSLNRHMLPPYGCDWTHAPNFSRLAQRTVTFDRSYVCSMPCMPARRDLHTGRPSFLHRSWGPIEPYDDSVPEILKNNGIHTHLATDHYHYFEDGGATYHNRYSTWEFFRGQEGDPWMGQVAPPAIPDCVTPHNHVLWRQDWVNRSFMPDEASQPQPQTFSAGIDFIRRNHREDNWFLQIETFDPHEPFFSHQHYKDHYPHEYNGDHFDWPAYREATETPEQIHHCRMEYAALLSMCDAHLGKVLDLMDELKLWDDTMLIVWTDHGFVLGEHGAWAKIWLPFYQEIAHTPFFVWDPRSRKAGERRQALVQPAIDLGPTLLEFFGVESTPDMLGRPLRETIASDAPVRQAAIFGVHGGHVNITDGRFVYMRAAADASNQPLFDYTLMPTHMRSLFRLEELQSAELAGPFSFTKGCPVLKTPKKSPGMRSQATRFPTALYDVENDPGEAHPLDDPEVEAQMVRHLVNLMRQCDAPPEQFERLGLDSSAPPAGKAASSAAAGT